MSRKAEGPERVGVGRYRDGGGGGGGLDRGQESGDEDVKLEAVWWEWEVGGRETGGETEGEQLHTKG